MIEKKIREARPLSPKNPVFFQELRKKLLQPSSSMETISTPMPLFRQFALAAVGGAIALVIAVPLTYQLSTEGTLFSSPFSPQYSNLGSNAFGTLAFNASSLSARGGDGMGGGGGQSEDASALSIDSKMIMPTTNYTYVYKGDDLALQEISNTVYRKVGSMALSGSSLLTTKVGPVDLSAFSGSTLQNFSVKQGDKNGYSVYVSEDGSIYISANEGLWYTYSENTPQLTESDMPSDEELVAIAESFLSRYRIDTAAFGEPTVDRRGVNYALMTATQGMPAYFPDTLNVIYPLVVDGQEVKGTDGAPYGMTLSINVRNDVVSGASIIGLNTFERSEYTLETDAEKILAIAEKGGPWNYSYGEAEKTVEVEIGTPEVILMTHWNWNDGKSETLFIPALRFPIMNPPSDFNLYQDAVVVPLPEQILSSINTEPVYRILEEDAKAAE